MRRFFTERTNLRPGSSVKLPENEASHIRDSLRLQKGEEVLLFNGENEFIAELGLVTKNVVMANILSAVQTSKQGVKATKELILAMSLIKPQNFELVLQKGTELGVTKFLPIIAEFSQQDASTVARKQERWEKIILEACKQSERLDIPELLTPLNLEGALALETTKIAFVLTRQIQDIAGLDDKKLVDANHVRQLAEENIAVYIGPEGGFSPRENKLLVKSNAVLTEIAAGRILKAETAAIVALGLLQA